MRSREKKSKLSLIIIIASLVVVGLLAFFFLGMGDLLNNNTSSEVERPWEEEGSKQPSEYTWKEFNDLEGDQQIAFQNAFENFEEFEKWMENANPEASETEVEIPWEETGEKQPNEYTWKEFEALDGAQQIAFQNSFEKFEDFEKWMEKVGGNAGQAEQEFEELELPWENGGKQPSEYTWDEFNDLEGGQQIAFQESFGSIDKFDEWLQANKPQ